jgi:predicted choloylglycine hydrolase
MEEFTAYAEAQRWNAELLWQQSCRVNLKARFRLGAEGCSSVAWYDNDRAIIGRNYDYWPLQARRQRIRFRPHTNVSHATIGARGGVPCGRYDGMNEHGLFVSLHVVMTDTPDETQVQPGVPFHLVGRLALEMCSSATEAIELLTHIPHLSSLNYLVADPREAYVVEADPRRVRVLPMDGPVIAATNHYRHPDMRQLQGNRVLANSACRWQKLNSLREMPNHSNDVDALMDQAAAVMSDRSAPVCGLSGSLTTLWSCVAELNTVRIRYAPGAPCHTPYEDMPSLRPDRA